MEKQRKMLESPSKATFGTAETLCRRVDSDAIQQAARVRSQGRPENLPVHTRPGSGGGSN